MHHKYAYVLLVFYNKDLAREYIKQQSGQATSTSSIMEEVMDALLSGYYWTHRKL
jgi:hypothetical protein